MIKEAARCSDGEDVNLDIDDVIEFIGDAVPPLMPVSTDPMQAATVGDGHVGQVGAMDKKQEKI